MAKQYATLLFFMIYSIVGIGVPSMQLFSECAGHLFSHHSTADRENEPVQSESESGESGASAEFCNRSSFPPHHFWGESLAMSKVLRPDPDIFGVVGEIQTPPPKLI
jgi:hypothetical protein